MTDYQSVAELETARTVALKMIFYWVVNPLKVVLQAMAVVLMLLAAAFPAAANAKTLVVGCDVNLKPFEFRGQDGKYTGFDIDLWEAVAGDLQLDFVLKPMPFELLLSALQKGDIDVAIAGITINAEREQVLDFSHPYFDAGLSLMVRAEREDIYGIGALTDKIIATKGGTTSAKFATEIQQKEVILFPDIEQAYEAVVKGSADAVIYDAPALLYYLTTAGQGKVKSVGPRYQRQSYGIAFPQGSPLREPVNISLLKLLESGRYDTISRKWFGNVD